MCTMIVQQAEIDGGGKGAGGWFTVRQVNVSYDHPYHVRLEHALNIDFVNEAEGAGARVAVELTVESARHLVRTIQAVLAQAEAGGYLKGPASAEPRRHAAPGPAAGSGGDPPDPRMPEEGSPADVGWCP